MLIKWKEVRFSFRATVKWALSIQLLASILFWATTMEITKQYAYMWIISLFALGGIGFTTATMASHVKSLAAIFPECDYSQAYEIGVALSMLGVALERFIMVFEYFNYQLFLDNLQGNDGEYTALLMRAMFMFLV